MSTIRQAILETLNRRGPLPLGDIALATGLSKMATRYHLGLLTAEGLVVCQDSRRHGVGRPRTVYALSEEAFERLPNRYDLLAERLLGGMVNTLGAGETCTLLREMGVKAAADAASESQSAAHYADSARLADAARVLNERGYMARVARDAHRDGPALVLCNCPFRRVAQAHGQVCEMDRAMVGALVDAPVEMTHCIAHRDAHCRFVISKEAKDAG